MKLTINGIHIDPLPGQSILDMIRILKIDETRLSQRPLAAKIAGEVFNLNYIPVRVTRDEEEPASIRKAMAASGGVIELLYYHNPSGKDVYCRTAQFLLFLALHRLWPNGKASMSSTVGSTLYIRVDDEQFCAQTLKDEVKRLVQMDIPLIRKRTSTQAAIAHFQQSGQLDKARLLQWRKKDYFDQYFYGNFSDYYYGELAPSSGYLQVWDILPAEGGFLFIYPNDTDPDTVSAFLETPKLFSVITEGDRWCRLMECKTVADLNDLTQNHGIRQLIRVNEALHEKRYSQIADMICERGCRAVMLAGPSSSGKTTSANRLATQLRVHGKKPIMIGLDDYYVNRDTIKPGPDGQIDLEHINTIDTLLFREHVKKLLDGKEVELPTFNFITGKRQWDGHKIQLHTDTVIIVEGLHALNPALMPEDFSREDIFRLFVSPILPLNLDDHNRIPSSYLRLLRRIVRDYETRGSSVEKTMSMWDSVRRGEKLWIFPFLESADVIFNSATLYELAVLKKHIYPLLTEITPDKSCYEQVRAIVKILNYVVEADVDDEIPPTSLIREFIGGNSFYK